MDRSSDFTQLKKGYLHQKTELGEEVLQNVCPCVEFENTYEFYAGDSKREGGAPLIVGNEKSNLFCRFLCGPLREFTMPWTRGNDEKFTSVRPFRLSRCFNLSPLCLAKIETEHRGAKLGHVTEDCFTCFTPKFTLYDNMGVPYARIRGPSGCFGGVFEYCSSPEFTLEEMNGRQLIKLIEKKRLAAEGKSFENVAMDILGDSDDYILAFPEGATPEQKANIISSLILLDYMFFEGDKSSLENGCYLGTFYCMGCVCPITCSANDSNRRNTASTQASYDF